MKFLQSIKNLKGGNNEFKYFNVGIFLLPSVPLISSIILLLTAIPTSLKKKNYFRDIWNLPFILSTFLMIISCISNSIFREEIYKNSYSLEQIWIGLFNWIPYFWLFWVFQNFSLNHIHRQKICFLLLSGSIPVLISGMLQYFFKLHGPFVFIGGLVTWYSREIDLGDGMTGLFNNANYLGMWLNILWPFSLMFFLENRKNLKKSLATITIMILVLCCTILTFSRNAWLGLIIGTILLLGKKSLRWVLPLILLASFPIIMGLGLFPNPNITELGQNIVPNRVLHQFIDINFANLSALPRVQIWNESINLISQKPFLGWGSASFPILFGIKNNSTFFGHTHNLPLEISISFGIPAALILITSIILIINKSKIKIFTSNNKINQISFDKACFVSTFLIFFSHMFDIQYFDIRIGLTFWILLGALKNIFKNPQNI